MVKSFFFFKSQLKNKYKMRITVNDLAEHQVHNCCPINVNSFSFKKCVFIDIRERGSERDRDIETSMRETSMGCLLHDPY